MKENDEVPLSPAYQVIKDMIKAEMEDIRMSIQILGKDIREDLDEIRRLDKLARGQHE